MNVILVNCPRKRNTAYLNLSHFNLTFVHAISYIVVYMLTLKITKIIGAQYGENTSYFLNSLYFDIYYLCLFVYFVQGKAQLFISSYTKVY